MCKKQFIYTTTFKKHLVHFHKDKIGKEKLEVIWEKYCTFIKSPSEIEDQVKDNKIIDLKKTKLKMEKKVDIKINADSKERNNKEEVKHNMKKAIQKIKTINLRSKRIIRKKEPNIYSRGYETPITVKSKKFDFNIKKSTNSTNKRKDSSLSRKQIKINDIKEEDHHANLKSEKKITQIFHIERVKRRLSFNDHSEILKSIHEDKKENEVGPDPKSESENYSAEKVFIPNKSSIIKKEQNQEFIDQSLDEEIKEIIINLPDHPSIPLDSFTHSHVHGEMCGHIIVSHEDHFDFIEDGKLHYVDKSGKTYPHKLGITKENPVGCKPIATPDHLSVPTINDSPIEGLITPHVKYVNSLIGNIAKSIFE